MEQKEITSIITAGVDGRNSNNYRDMLIRLAYMVKAGVVGVKDTMTIRQLYEALRVALKEQDKAIDKYLEQDVS